MRVFEVSLRDIARFQDRFDTVYAGALDPGESEALAYLAQSSEPFSISSGDAIVYRDLGRLGLGDQGLSLEEVLREVGLGRSQLPWACQKKFREKYTKEGEIDATQGKGLKRSS